MPITYVAVFAAVAVMIESPQIVSRLPPVETALSGGGVCHVMSNGNDCSHFV